MVRSRLRLPPRSLAGWRLSVQNHEIRIPDQDHPLRNTGRTSVENRLRERIASFGSSPGCCIPNAISVAGVCDPRVNAILSTGLRLQDVLQVVEELALRTSQE